MVEVSRLPSANENPIVPTMTPITAPRARLKNVSLSMYLITKPFW